MHYSQFDSFESGPYSCTAYQCAMDVAHISYTHKNVHPLLMTTLTLHNNLVRAQREYAGLNLS